MRIPPSANESSRIHYYNRLMDIEGSQVHADLRRPGPLFATDVGERERFLQRLLDFMKVWPMYEEECAIGQRRGSLDDREVAAWSFYMQTYWDYFARIPTRPLSVLN